LFYSSATNVFVRVVDGTLSPVGDPIALSHITAAFDMRVVGENVALMGVGRPGTTQYLALLRQGALVDEVALQQTASSYVTTVSALVADDANGLVACWSWVAGVWCRYLSPIDARPLSPPFAVSLDETIGWDVARAKCGAAILVGKQFTSGASGTFRMIHPDPSGAVDTRNIDSLWLSPSRAIRLLAMADGRLLRIMEATTGATAEGAMDLLLTTLACQPPPEPVTDCGALVDSACGFACDTANVCPDTGSQCTLMSGSGASLGFAASACPTTMASNINCEVIDAPRCRDDLAAPQECGWMIPASCVARR
jgi:hypothetical protein